MSAMDTWSALFALWHKQEHQRELYQGLEELEQRIIRLEALLAAKSAPIEPVYKAPRLGPFGIR